MLMTRRTLLQSSMAAAAAASFGMPTFAQGKPMVVNMFGGRWENDWRNSVLPNFAKQINRKVDLDKAARNVLTQEQFEQDGGDGTVASWRNTVTVENVHPNTTVSFRMNNLSGSAADLKLYAYGADGKLAEVGKELWSITDETGAAVDTLSDGTLYELRVSIADGGALDLSEAEKKIIISVVLAK